jgi:hypothetical protein
MPAYGATSPLGRVPAKARNPPTADVRAKPGRGGLEAASARTYAAGYASLPSMSKMQSEVIETFTSSERDYIRRQLDRFFSTLPTVADGFQLKTWRGGPEAGKPKLPPLASVC